MFISQEAGLFCHNLLSVSMYKKTKFPFKSQNFPPNTNISPQFHSHIAPFFPTMSTLVNSLFFQTDRYFQSTKSIFVFFFFIITHVQLKRRRGKKKKNIWRKLLKVKFFGFSWHPPVTPLAQLTETNYTISCLNSVKSFTF